MTGTVLRMERASIHDGPGLRTVVFLKGCPLRCRWCSTPESQSATVQVGLNREKCTGCGACVAACPRRAVRPGTAGAVLDTAACDNCMECVAACPNNARPVYGGEMTPGQVVGEILKDEVFFYHSGGGVTLSGGEPLAQPVFAAQILELCREAGVGTAMETSFYAPFSALETVLPHVDHLYVDIKHMNPVQHRWWTSVDNGLVLENLGRLEEAGFRGSLVIRTPVIPAANDSLDNLVRTARFASELPRFSHLELLPYHRMGMAAYRNLGLAYGLEALEKPAPEQMESLRHGIREAVSGVTIR